MLLKWFRVGIVGVELRMRLCLIFFVCVGLSLRVVVVLWVCDSCVSVERVWVCVGLRVGKYRVLSESG